MEPNTLPANLRILCGHYRSVAEVCRLIGINRQQFNKYLGGTSQPSVRTLRRISATSSVSMRPRSFLPTDEFAPLIRIRAERRLDRLRRCPARSMTIVERHAGLTGASWKRYCGYYAGFMRTPALPKMILRYLTVIYQSDGHSYAKSIERLAEGRLAGPRTRRLGTLVTKYLGLVLHGDDRIYLWEHDPYFHQTSRPDRALPDLPRPAASADRPRGLGLRRSRPPGLFDPLSCSNTSAPRSTCARPSAACGSIPRTATRSIRPCARACATRSTGRRAPSVRWASRLVTSDLRRWRDEPGLRRTLRSHCSRAAAGVASAFASGVDAKARQIASDSRQQRNCIAYAACGYHKGSVTRAPRLGSSGGVPRQPGMGRWCVASARQGDRATGPLRRCAGRRASGGAVRRLSGRNPASLGSAARGHAWREEEGGVARSSQAVGASILSNTKISYNQYSFLSGWNATGNHSSHGITQVIVVSDTQPDWG